MIKEDYIEIAKNKLETNAQKIMKEQIERYYQIKEL